MENVFKSGFNNNPKKSLVVVDNFYKEPDLIREFAINQVKFEFSGYHKGQRSVDRLLLMVLKKNLKKY